MKKILNIIDKLFKVDIWVIKGKEQNSNQDLVLFYAGSEVNKNYLCKLIYDSKYEQQHKGKNWIWNANNLAQKQKEYFTASVIEARNCIYRLFAKKDIFAVPAWLNFYLDGALDLDKMVRKSNSATEDVRRIKKNNLSYVVTKEEKDFDNFYHNMYKPRTVKRFDDTAVLSSYESLKKKFQNNELLLVKQGDEYIGGHLIFYKNGSALFGSGGIKNGDYKYAKMGSPGATFYFSLDFLKDKGYKKIGLGLTRGFLNDGVLKFKRKWSPKIAIDSIFGNTFLIKPFNFSEALKSFLTNNPFICKAKGNFSGMIFAESKPDSEKKPGKTYREYHLSGMRQLFLYDLATGEKKEITQQ